MESARARGADVSEAQSADTSGPAGCSEAAAAASQASSQRDRASSRGKRRGNEAESHEHSETANDRARITTRGLATLLRPSFDFQPFLLILHASAHYKRTLVTYSVHSRTVLRRSPSTAVNRNGGFSPDPVLLFKLCEAQRPHRSAGPPPGLHPLFPPASPRTPLSPLLLCSLSSLRSLLACCRCDGFGRRAGQLRR